MHWWLTSAYGGKWILVSWNWRERREGVMEGQEREREGGMEDRREREREGRRE